MTDNYQIENEQLLVVVSSKGAELQHIIDRSTDHEYMWNGDPAFWGKKSPILFPIVGTLKENTYFFNHNAYHLERHGFAREMIFSLVTQNKDQLIFSLKSSARTHTNYPFHFELRVHYLIVGKKLSVSYEVINTDDKIIWFSIGGHPAFKIPMFEDDTYSDYKIEFETNEVVDKWPVEAGGLIATAPIPFLKNEKELPLTKELFKNDALVFKSLKSEQLKLISGKTGHGLRFSWPGFPYLGIWAAPGADFVCIEPWCGVADSSNTNQAFINKEGINELEPGTDFARTWSVEII